MKNLFKIICLSMVFSFSACDVDPECNGVHFCDKPSRDNSYTEYGPNCTSGCRCGNSCISCNYTCHQ
jgi:hypothetical protein